MEEGEYTARITDVDLKEDKANESQYLHVAYEVERGEGQLPFELRERIYFSNDNHQRLDEFLSEALQQDPAGSIEGEDLIGKTGAIEIETKHNKAGNLYNYVNAWDFSSVGKESEVDFDA